MINFKNQLPSDSTDISGYSRGLISDVRRASNQNQYDFGKAFKKFYQKEPAIKFSDDVNKYLKIAEAQRSKAVKELNAKKSSSGMTYQEAKRIMYQIESDFYKKQYNPLAMMLAQPKFDPEKLQGTDKLLYFKAKEACLEIEIANPELVKLNKDIKIHIDSKPYLGTGGLAQKGFPTFKT